MKTNSIEWHEQCLANWRNSVSAEEKRLRLLSESLARQKHQMLILEAQITAAKKEGRSSFDADKFWIKRKK
jgi:hypothetical protein